MYNISGLQKICDALLENPSWSIAHLVAFFNLTEHVNNAKVLELIDFPDHEHNMTPMQVSLCVCVCGIPTNLHFSHVGIGVISRLSC